MEENMKIIGVDDERIALEALEESIKEAQPEAEIICFRRSSQALEYCQEHQCDIAFLDIQMSGMDGISLAREMKCMNPKINIIFTTGYNEYCEEAFRMHVSGYVTKPITAKKIREELDNLRYPLPASFGKRVQIHTFGNFEVYIDEKPADFNYSKTKEMLAYLVDRKGAYCTNAEIMGILWQDQKRSGYLRNLKKDLLDTLRKVRCEDIIDSKRGNIRINKEKVDCDYYDWESGKPYAINEYRGEYLAQYSWAEFTNGEISKRK